MITLVKAVETCGACPSQWDMWDKHGNYYYVRYRFDHLTVHKVHVGQTLKSVYLDGEPIYDESYVTGEPMDGYMAFESMLTHTNLFELSPSSNTHQRI